MIKKSITGSLRGLALGVCTAALTGCAVMTIDVDVYKGPLINQDDVQEHQFANLAVSVKPLLLQLRDTLECRKREANYDTSFDDCVRYKKEERQPGAEETTPLITLEPDWMTDSTDLISSPARKVNEILYLYIDESDASPRAIRQLKDSFTPLTKKLNNAKFQLLPNKKKDESLWRMFESKILQYGANIKGLLENADFTATDTFLNNRECLAEVYKAVLAPSLHVSKKGDVSGWRDPTPGGDWLPDACLGSAIAEKSAGEELSTSILTAANAAVSILDKTTRGIFGVSVGLTGGTIGNPRSDKEYAVMADEKVVRQHAIILFGIDGGDTTELFVDRVTSISDAYNDVRKTTSKIWNLAVDTMANADVLTLNEDEREKLINRLAKFISDITELERLALTLNVETDQRVSRLKSLVSERLGNGKDTPILLRRGPDQVGNSYDELRRALGRVLTTDTRDASLSLLRANELFESMSTKEYVRRYSNAEWKNLLMESIAESYAVEEARQYGFAFSFVTSAEFSQVLDGITDSTAVTGGLEAGRPSRGLDNLTKDYERAIIKTENEQAIDEINLELEGALLHFAEKLTKLANNQVLLNNDNRDEIEQFTIALQAFGNAIIVNADHVFRRRDHEEADEARGAAELSGFVASVDGRAQSQIIDDLIALVGPDGDNSELSATVTSVNRKLDYANDAKDRRGTRNRSTTPPDTDPDRVFKTKIDRLAMVLDAHEVLSADTNKKAIAKVTDKATGKNQSKISDVVAGIKSWLKLRLEQFSKTDESHQDYVKVVNTQAYMTSDAPSFANDATNDDTAKQLEKVIGLIKDSKDRAERTLEDDVDSLDTEKDKGDGELAAAEKSSRLLTAQKSAILDKAKKNNVGMGDPAGLLDTVAEVMTEVKANSASSADDKSAADRVIVAVADQKVRLALMKAPDHLYENPSRSAVLDQYMTLLRYGETLALQQGNTKRAEDYRNAIESAERQKADATFIRPAAAYLRSSLAATGLQDNTSFAWKNTLARHSFRGLPLIGETFSNFNDRDRYKILNQVDKQFWQNINRVRVAGAGDTNYAITKDDIGNWYVKSYSADPQDIINSAQNLALFNIGGQLGNVDLLGSARNRVGQNQADPTGGDANEGNTEPNEEAERSIQRPALARLFDKHTESYQSKATADFDKLVELISANGLKKKIADVWKENNDTKAFAPNLNANLDAAFPAEDSDRDAFALKTDGNNNSLDGSALAAKIPSGLRLALRYYRVLAASIPGTLLTETQIQALANAKADVSTAESNLKEAEDALANTSDEDQRSERQEAVEVRKSELETAQTARETAQEIHDNAERAENAALKTSSVLTKDVLEAYLTSRIGSVESYETAIGFIGDATNPE